MGLVGMSCWLAGWCGPDPTSSRIDAILLTKFVVPLQTKPLLHHQCNVLPTVLDAAGRSCLALVLPSLKTKARLLVRTAAGKKRPAMYGDRFGPAAGRNAEQPEATQIHHCGGYLG